MLETLFRQRALPAVLVAALGFSLILIYAQQRPGGSSASAAVGQVEANSSASISMSGQKLITYTFPPPPGSTVAPPPKTASFPATSAVTLMVTDVNSDGKQDIKILLTTPVLPPGGTDSNFPSAVNGVRSRHGVFVTNGETGLTLVNTVTSTPGPPGP